METDKSAKALIEHWDWAAKRGLMNTSTARTWRAACAKVLGVNDDLAAVDVTTLDLDEAVRRFKNLKGKELHPDSVEAYEQRFRLAHKAYLAYLDDPGGWRPMQRPTKADHNGNGGQAKARGRRAPNPEPEEKPTTPGVTGPTILPLVPGGLLDHPLPLRQGVVAHLVLPPDLKEAEANRLKAYIDFLGMEPPAA
jgi:hypothetical protein